MSDDAAKPESPKPDGRGKTPGSLSALEANRIKPGEVRNKKGTNGWRKYQAKVAKFFAQMSQANGKETRFDRVMQAAYASALVPGPKGSMDRKLIWEQCVGKPRQQLEVMGDGGGPLTTVTRQETLSAEEMAQRFLRAARIAKQILDHDAALSTAPQAFSEIDVSAQELPEPSTSEAPTPHGASMGALSVGQAPTPQPGAPTTTGPNAGMIRRGS